ncbi:hypothetical protein [Marinoscillum pacificum]|uniref:hypothetical protein n=1 Tax=Marinoscillum pacificum TaxID=392723 RepID=UPI0021588994|nr:hypothetical protein [Marinoscillum pacificum]
MKNSFITEIEMMVNRENKISKGLDKLIKSKRSNHFPNSQDIFVGDPAVRSNYFDAFYQAQLTEIAYSEAKF